VGLDLAVGVWSAAAVVQNVRSCLPTASLLPTYYMDSSQVGLDLALAYLL
jgi:hypothetical protein